MNMKPICNFSIVLLSTGLKLSFVTAFSLKYSTPTVSSLSQHAKPGPQRMHPSFSPHLESSPIQWAGLRKSQSSLHMAASAMSNADLAVRLDQPVLSPSQYRSTSSYMWKTFLSVLVSDLFKAAVLALFIAVTLSLISKSIPSILSRFQPAADSIRHIGKRFKGRVARMNDRIEKVKGSRKDKVGVPMTFDDEETDGWGVCTLANKEPLGGSRFTKYDFDLPTKDHYLNLGLGQQVSLCCLDSQDRVSQDNFYLFNPTKELGKFSIVAPSSDDRFAVKKRAANQGNFIEVLEKQLHIGDEVALQPGSQTLLYRGEYLPVTDMVYITYGEGIVPVLDQVKAVLPTGSSSVKAVSVIWSNGNESDFDIAMSTLEDEYFKHSTKLAVSCIVDETEGDVIDKTGEVEEALPLFNPGTMAVVAGPKFFAKGVRSLLIEKGYPEECICVLP